jgi:thioester reductase-like protein
VRAVDDREARERLGRAAFDPRVVAHAGDVSAPAMGLAPDGWRELTRAVGHVVHAAASVSLALSFDSLEKVNVRGALEVARFVRSGGAKTLHHVSSLAVLASTTSEREILDEETVLAGHERVLGAYPQSKAVAEAVLRRSVEDLRIIRPGLLTGDTATGASAPRCPLFTFLRAIAALGCVPEADFDALRVDVTPIDCAARAMAIAIASPGGVSRLHVASERGASLGELVRAVRRRTEVRVVSPDAFLRDARSRLPREGALAIVASAHRLLGTDAHRGADLFLHTGRLFPSELLRSFDPDARWTAPTVDDALLDRYVAVACGESK